MTIWCVYLLFISKCCCIPHPSCFYSSLRWLTNSGCWYFSLLYPSWSLIFGAFCILPSIVIQIIRVIFLEESWRDHLKNPIINQMICFSFSWASSKPIKRRWLIRLTTLNNNLKLGINSTPDSQKTYRNWGICL